MNSNKPEYSFVDLETVASCIGRDREWHTEGVTAPGQVIVWAAREGGCKTMAWMDHSIEAIMGGRWLGKFRVKHKGTVIYCDGEIGEEQFARRLTALARGKNYEPREIMSHLRYFNSSCMQLHEGDPAAQWIASRLEEETAPVSQIVIDTWRAHCYGPEDTAETAKAAWKVFNRWRAIHPKMQIVILAHLNKSGVLNGSRALATQADLIIQGTDAERSWYSPTKRRTVRHDDPINQRFTFTLATDESADERTSRITLQYRDGTTIAAVSQNADDLSHLATRALGYMRTRPDELISTGVLRKTLGNPKTDYLKTAMGELTRTGHIEVIGNAYRFASPVQSLKVASL